MTRSLSELRIESCDALHRRVEKHCWVRARSNHIDQITAHTLSAPHNSCLDLYGPLLILRYLSFAAF